uniref:Secreted protein n=1 Tax=Rhizophora mucronata TaxID=61149 RepID=A0A2P2KGW7_RHIMU
MLQSSLTSSLSIINFLFWLSTLESSASISLLETCRQATSCAQASIDFNGVFCQHLWLVHFLYMKDHHILNLSNRLNIKAKSIN